jgi:hypothetical protein
MSSKEWRVRALAEKDLVLYAKKLQSILNRLEIDGFEFTVEGPGVNQPVINADTRFMSLITGFKDRQLMDTKMIDEDEILDLSKGE